MLRSVASKTYGLRRQRVSPLTINNVNANNNASSLSPASIISCVAHFTDSADPRKQQSRNQSTALQRSLLSAHNADRNLRHAKILSPLLRLQQQQNQSKRGMASWLPEAVQQFSVWGASGHMIKAIHMDGTVPYWACFALINVGLRTALLPLVFHSARTSARFAKVAPEIQFIVTLFQTDLKKLREQKKSLLEKRYLFTQNLQTIQSIYKLHKINPLTVFLSPLLQIPFFWYVAVDLRKIVNGADPELAQALTEASFWWVTDLTDPDPWYGLPIAAGVMLYFNVEVAMGRRSLSGPTASKSDFASLFKDGFQTLAVFMPCFASQSPAGLQIYLLSSFTFTLFQSAALRSDAVRNFIGLPSVSAPPQEPKYAKQFMEFKKLEQKAREIRGDGPVLGKNVLAHGFETSFPGTSRPSTIEGSEYPFIEEIPEESSTAGSDSEKPTMNVAPKTALGGGPFIHGISAPPDQIDEQTAAAWMAQEAQDKQGAEGDAKYLEQASEEAMEAANKGVKMAPVDKPMAKVETINSKKFRKQKSKRGKGSKRNK